MNKSSTKVEKACTSCGKIIITKISNPSRLVRCGDCKKNKIIRCMKCNEIKKYTIKRGVESTLCDDCISNEDLEFGSISSRTITKIAQRADLKCGNCGWCECTCDIHHIISTAEGGSDALSNLAYLCPNCHRKAHRGLISTDRLHEISLKDFDWRSYYNDVRAIKKDVIKLKTIEGNSLEEISIKTGRSKYSVARTLRTEGVEILLPRKKKFEVPKEELESLIKDTPMAKIGQMFGVSDNAVKKRCMKLGIELKPMRGQWTKIKAQK